jgi:pimeloyl-ACP methyl ester carboxylesterase
MKPAMRQLARECRAISYSLCGDIGSGARVDAALGFENYVRQLDDVLDETGVERAAVCGVSFGGFVALHYAATRPSRVSALILASAPAPGFNPNAQQARWLARPWLSAPAFVATAPLRLWPEIRTGLSSWRARISFAVVQSCRVIGAPIIPSLMADRMRHAQDVDFQSDCSRIHVPALVITGEDGLDKVVPVAVTRTYASLIPGARYEIMQGTGHIGAMTQPGTFARIVGRFIHANHH